MRMLTLQIPKTLTVSGCGSCSPHNRIDGSTNEWSFQWRGILSLHAVCMYRMKVCICESRSAELAGSIVVVVLFVR